MLKFQTLWEIKSDGQIYISVEGCAKIIFE